jgi:hypothetical protein
VNVPFICNNIQATPAYGVYLSQLIWYSRACGSYHDLLDRGLLLTRKLLNHVFLVVRLKLFESFTVATMIWLIVREYLCHKWPRICSICRYCNPSFPHSWLITGFVTRLTRRVHKWSRNCYHLSSCPVFIGVRVGQSLVFCVVFCISLLVIVSLLYWPLHCHFLITSLVSSNLSHILLTYRQYNHDLQDFRTFLTSWSILFILM